MSELGRSSAQLVRAAKLRRAPGCKFAKITGKAGVAAPYQYTAVQVVHDGSSDFAAANFSTLAGAADLSWKLLNVQEIGPGGEGVAAVEIDSIVTYWPMGSYYAFSSSNYKGTY